MSADDPPDDKLGDEPFSFAVTRDGKIFISWRDRRVMTLKGEEARRFAERLARLDARGVQLALAKITGNFKRGNER